MIKLLFTIISIFGYILNINNKKVASYYLWIVSNSYWMLYNFFNKEYQLAVMFTVYSGFCIYGIIKNK